MFGVLVVAPVSASNSVEPFEVDGVALVAADVAVVDYAAVVDRTEFGDRDSLESVAPSVVAYGATRFVDRRPWCM